MQHLDWIPAKAGCYWNADDFCISTYMTGFGLKPFPASGYVLTRKTAEIGRFPTLEAAQQAAEQF